MNHIIDKYVLSQREELELSYTNCDKKIVNNYYL